MHAERFRPQPAPLLALRVGGSLKVSRGNALIAELLRLSRHIPPPFYLATKEDKARYGDLLPDFAYLSSVELCEKRIEQAGLLEQDDDFRETHLEMVTRFFKLFEGVYLYVADIQRYLEDIEQGVFIQITLESVLMNTEGRQLLVEATYLWGVMLLLMDAKIEGAVRERILVSYYRYKGQQESVHMDEVFKLCRRTNYTPAMPTYPKQYPESLFKRFPLPEETLRMIIGRLRTDDIYHNMAHFPLPAHRSTALAAQAAQLYVLLFFVPDVLVKEEAAMREIVDKHFNDNWTVSFYMGFNADLAVAWEPYKAARLAVANTLRPADVRDRAATHGGRLPTLLQELKGYLAEGVLVEEFVLDRIPKLVNCMRHCNVTLRWLMLHGNSENKKLREVVATHHRREDLLVLLLHLAQYEFVLKRMFAEILQKKQARWDEHKKQSSERMVELSEYFSGEKALTRVAKNQALQEWFTHIAGQITALDFNDSTLAGRKIQHLMQALEEVEQFHQIEGSLQVKQFLADTRTFLMQMIRVVNVKEELLVTISLVSDISYAWQIMDGYIPMLQARIKADPSSVLMMRSMFLKLASILDLPLVRINQAASPDLVSVSEYYSGELVSFVRRVLNIVPASMFETLGAIITIQTSRLKELPTRLEKERLKELAQLDERYELARATHQVSVYTEGILTMETTLVGVIQVDPRQLLEDGVRMELVREVATGLHQVMVFKPGCTAGEFKHRLSILEARLDGLRRSFEYMGDYINLIGLKVWMEEFGRIVRFSIEQETNTFLRKKIYAWDSEYQSDAIPIPIFTPVDRSVNWLGRVARQLLALTDTRFTTYVEGMTSWFDAEGREVVGIKTFSLLMRALTVFGVTGLDRFLCFMIVRDLQLLLRFLRRTMDKKFKAALRTASAALEPLTAIPADAAKLYDRALAATAKVWPELVDLMTRIGQMQLIRRSIANELNAACKLESNTLRSALDVLNTAVLAEVQAHYRSPATRPYPTPDLMGSLTDYLETAGICTPFLKIYVTSEPVDNLAYLCFLFTLSQLGKFVYNGTLHQIVVQKKKGDFLDFFPFLTGLVTLLKQFHSSQTQAYMAYCGQWVRSHVNAASARGKQAAALPETVPLMVEVMTGFVRIGKLQRQSIERYVPPFLLDSAAPASGASGAK